MVFDHEAEGLSTAVRLTMPDKHLFVPRSALRVYACTYVRVRVVCRPHPKQCCTRRRFAHGLHFCTRPPLAPWLGLYKEGLAREWQHRTIEARERRKEAFKQNPRLQQDSAMAEQVTIVATTSECCKFAINPNL